MARGACPSRLHRMAPLEWFCFFIRRFLVWPRAPASARALPTPGSSADLPPTHLDNSKLGRFHIFKVTLLEGQGQLHDQSDHGLLYLQLLAA